MLFCSRMRLIPLLAQCFMKLCGWLTWETGSVWSRGTVRFSLLIGRELILSFDGQQRMGEDTKLNTHLHIGHWKSLHLCFSVCYPTFPQDFFYVYFLVIFNDMVVSVNLNAAKWTLSIQSDAMQPNFLSALNQQTLFSNSSGDSTTSYIRLN